MNKNIIATPAQAVSKVPSIKGVKPVGSQVLVELLTPQEILGTELYIPEEGKGRTINGAPQGYILDGGPLVDFASWGFKKGDRVTLSGSFTPLPEEASKNSRPLSLVEPHCIKAVLLE
jgi:hypothetical protein